MAEQKGKKASNNSTEVLDLLQFMQFVGQLKNVKRTGWVERGVKDPESVADHMYRMAMMTMLISNKDGLEQNHCMKLALIHDLAESIVGDISPSQGISQEEKHRREKEAMDQMASLLPEKIGREITALWEEYESRSSAEARFVKDLDRFEMILQAYEYEKEEKDRVICRVSLTLPKRFKILDINMQISDVLEGKFENEEVKAWVEQLHKLRNEPHVDEKS